MERRVTFPKRARLDGFRAPRWPFDVTLLVHIRSRVDCVVPASEWLTRRSRYSVQHPHQPAVQRIPRHADVDGRPSADVRAPAPGTDHTIGHRRRLVLAAGARPQRRVVRPGRPHAVQLRRIVRVS